MPKFRFTLVFDFFNADSKDEALKKFESLGCPNTFGQFYTIRKIEEVKNGF